MLAGCDENGVQYRWGLFSFWNVLVCIVPSSMIVIVRSKKSTASFDILFSKLVVFLPDQSCPWWLKLFGIYLVWLWQWWRRRRLVCSRIWCMIDEESSFLHGSYSKSLNTYKQHSFPWLFHFSVKSICCQTKARFVSLSVRCLSGWDLCWSCLEDFCVFFGPFSESANCIVCIDVSIHCIYVGDY